MSYDYRTERVRLEVDHRRSERGLEYYAWYYYVESEAQGIWDVHPIQVLGDQGWELVSIDSNLIVFGSKLEGTFVATFKRLVEDNVSY